MSEKNNETKNETRNKTRNETGNETRNPGRVPMYLREKEYFELLRGELERRKGENVDITFRQVLKTSYSHKKECF